MALRKFLFQSAEGYSEEQAAADSILLGGLTMSGNIAMGSNKITGMADGTLATDAVTLQQLQAVSAGIDLKEAVQLATAAALPANTAAGSGVGKTLTMNAAGILTVDGVATVLGDYIMVKDESAGADVDHGIYEVTTAGTALVPAVLTRRVDFDGTPSGEVSNGSYAFVQFGTANANTGWSVLTLDPITIDTTPIEFTQFQGLANLTFDAGLVKSGLSVAVDLDTAADAQGAGTGGGTSGLEFDAGGAAGQLRVKVGLTGSINRLADGLGLELDGTTLSSTATGLKVLGLPSLFTVNGVAVSANVTAPNLDLLTGGGDASALHTHAAGAEAARIENSLAVDAAVAVGDPVYFTGTGDRIGPADAAVDAEARVIGVARTAQAVVGNPCEVVTAGEAAGVLAGATPGAAYYLQSGGGLGTSLPGASARVIQVGVAASATDLFVRIVDYGKKAA